MAVVALALVVVAAIHSSFFGLSANQIAVEPVNEKMPSLLTPYRCAIFRAEMDIECIHGGKGGGVNETKSVRQVEPRGIEPLTSALRTLRSPS